MPLRFGRRAYQRKYKRKQRERALANGLCPCCCTRPARRSELACGPGEKPIITCKQCSISGSSRRTAERRLQARNQDATSGEKPAHRRAKNIEKAEAGKTTETETRQLMSVRKCQHQFKEALKEVWNSACCVTGSTLAPLLRASHIKPWAWSTDEERRDRYNGLLLLPHLDALFDAGLITFKDNGKIIISTKVSEQDRDRLNLSPRFRLSGVSVHHLPYLQYHRAMVFEKPPRRRNRKDGRALRHDGVDAVDDVAA